MADRGDLRVGELRLRLSRRALAGTDAALLDAVRRGLPGHLDPAVAGPLAAELVRQARRVSQGRAGERS